MPLGLVARAVGRGAISAARYARGLARSRGGTVIGFLAAAERMTRAARFGYSSSRAYSHSISGRRRKRTDSGSLRRRNASFEYIYKY